LSRGMGTQANMSLSVFTLFSLPGLLLMALWLVGADAKAILSSSVSSASSGGGAHRRQHHMHHPHEEVVVSTSLGAIRGVKQAYDGHVVRAFLGVPYARKPAGRRRFGQPEMVEPWEGELIADRLARTCHFR